MKKLHTQGFTLIELLIVVTIIGVLAAVGLVSYRGISANARDNKRRADMSTVRQALVLMRSDTGAYPTRNTFGPMLTDLVNGDFISQPLPSDPRPTRSSYSYNGGGPTFCLCAELEDNTEGNSNGACGFGVATTHFCVDNP